VSALCGFAAVKKTVYFVHSVKLGSLRVTAAKIFKNANKTAHFAPKTNLVARCACYINKMCQPWRLGGIILLLIVMLMLISPFTFHFAASPIPPVFYFLCVALLPKLSG
jgi:hypothetical protein